MTALQAVLQITGALAAPFFLCVSGSTELTTTRIVSLSPVEGWQY